MTRDHGEKAGISCLKHQQALTRPRTMSLGALTLKERALTLFVKAQLYIFLFYALTRFALQ
jgi:hypothetical protein